MRFPSPWTTIDLRYNLPHKFLGIYLRFDYGSSLNEARNVPSMSEFVGVSLEERGGLYLLKSSMVHDGAGTAVERTFYHRRMSI